MLVAGKGVGARGRRSGEWVYDEGLAAGCGCCSPEGGGGEGRRGVMLVVGDRGEGSGLNGPALRCGWRSAGDRDGWSGP
ncbi:hypothetical protein Tco_1546796 [Tanacetum coccineum]